MLLTRGTEQGASEARFRALFDDHYRPIARYFRTRGHSAAEADDLTAAVFEVAWRRLDAVPEGDAAVPWLFTVAHNHSRNAWRKTQREAAFIADLEPSASIAAELQAEGAQEFAEVMQALGRLEPADRDIILLVAWDELSVSDAGQVLGLRSNAARTRLHRARRRLATLLEMQAGSADPPPPADHQSEGPDDA